MASTYQRYSFTLEITLLETSYPEVRRILLVPFNTNFEELHSAIAAAFGWNQDGRDPCTFWHFQSLQHESAKPDGYVHYDENFAYYADPSAGYDIEPPSLRGTALISEMFSNRTCKGEFNLNNTWLYQYNVTRWAHQIDVIGVHETKDGQISCLDGEGSIKRGAWQLMNFHLPVTCKEWLDADYARDDEIDLAGQSSFELDMAAITTRMETVQQAYDYRTLRLRQPYVDRIASLRQQILYLETWLAINKEPSTTVNDQASPTKRPRLQSSSEGASSIADDQAGPPKKKARVRSASV